MKDDSCPLFVILLVFAVLLLSSSWYSFTVGEENGRVTCRAVK